MSRVGYLPIKIPSNVKLSIVDSDVEVEGPKGKLSWTLPDGIRLNLAENVATLERPNDLRQYKSLHCLLYTSPSPRDRTRSRMPSSA